MSSREERTDALVIGGGPVGLFAALSLVDRGLSVQVLDADAERLVRGYACCLHPGAAKCFDRLGLLPAVLEASHRVDRFVFRHGTRETEVDFARIGGGFPYALTLRQADLEQVLDNALEQRSARVTRLQQVTSLEQRDGFVRVKSQAKLPVASRNANEPTHQLGGAPIVDDANFVIGADGYYSICRQALGTELVAHRPSKAFAVFEFMADLGKYEHEACISFDGGAASAFWPLGDGLGRWTFEVWEGLGEVPTLEQLQQLIASRAAWFKPKPEQLCWAAVAQFEHRLARGFGHGRLWLAGDAAHTTSPVGFQSMNRGFAEAAALAELIAGALYDDDHRPGRFDRFEQAQQDEWRRLFGLSAPAGQSMAIAEIAPCLPASGPELEALAAELGIVLE
jgi:2-polyprenyl-6-methoxyphenol hydroxylase-like FAD-dependent oxidoreductase